MRATQLLTTTIAAGFCILACQKEFAQTTEPEMRAVSVLSSHFETLVYKKSALLSSAEELNAQLQSRHQVLSSRALRLPFLELISALTAVGPSTVDDLKHSYESVLVGASDFTSPDGIGIVASRKCYVAVAGTGGLQGGVLAFQKATPFSVKGAEGVTWSSPPFEGHARRTDFYAGIIASTYFVLTNDRQTFEQTVHELASKEPVTDLRLPNGSLGRTVFGPHEYWAYRVFDRSRAKDVNAAGINSIPTGSLALAFVIDQSNNEGIIHVYSFADQAPTFLHSAPKVSRASESGVWRAALPLSNAETVQNALLELFYYFGFGMFL